MKIIDYMVLHGRFSVDFDNEVKRYVEMGWQPLGGIAVEGIGGAFYQAIVKYEEVSDNLSLETKQSVSGFKDVCLNHQYEVGFDDWGLPIVFCNICSRESTLEKCVNHQENGNHVWQELEYNGKLIKRCYTCSFKLNQ